jgi:hypothetical protein
MCLAGIPMGSGLDTILHRSSFLPNKEEGLVVCLFSGFGSRCLELAQNARRRQSCHLGCHVNSIFTYPLLVIPLAVIHNPIIHAARRYPRSTVVQYIFPADALHVRKRWLRSSRRPSFGVKHADRDIRAESFTPTLPHDALPRD